MLLYCCYYVPIVIYFIIIFQLFSLFLLLFQFLLLLLLLTSYSRASSLALLLPDWTPLGLYHLRLDHPGLGRSGSVPEGFHRPQGEVASGNCTPWWHHMQCLPRLVRSSMFYFTRTALPPRSFPKDTCFFGDGLLRSCSCSSAPWNFYHVPNPSGLWESILCHRRASTMTG